MLGMMASASLCQSKTWGASGVETPILDEGEVYTWFNPNMSFIQVSFFHSGDHE